MIHGINLIFSGSLSTFTLILVLYPGGIFFLVYYQGCPFPRAVGEPGGAVERGA